MESTQVLTSPPTTQQRRRVVVTGLGVVAAPGIGTPDFWAGLNRYPELGAREVVDWDPQAQGIERRQARRLDRFSQFALAATDQALQQAGSLDAPPETVGVSIATGIGGLASLEVLVSQAQEEEPRPSPLLVPMMMCNAAAAAVSIKYGFGGPATTPVVACAAGGQAIIDAFRSIAWGYCEAAVAGGSEGAVRRSTVIGFQANRALSPTGHCRPFDQDRDGFALGEGCGVLVLEERERALGRGATILAELSGAAATADAHHITAPHPEGEGAERAIRLALTDSGLEPNQVSYINAHGTGTDLNDRTEGEVVARVFAEQQPLISSIKGVTGHALGASGALEAVAAVAAIDTGQLPPNLGLETLDPEIPLEKVVKAPQVWEPGVVISNSFGFGGHNTVLVFSPPS